ncbi:hypothetical protein, partial [Thiorhodovibrio winogradskyi]
MMVNKVFVFGAKKCTSCMKFIAFSLVGLSLSPLTTFADETIYLDASSGAVTIAGGATDGLTRYLDFGGEDIYT